MLSTKIRNIIIASAAVAAVSIPAGASAAAFLPKPGTVSPTAVTQPTSTAQDAGGQGQGVTTPQCVALGATLVALQNMKTLAATTGNTEGLLGANQAIITVQEEQATACPTA